MTSYYFATNAEDMKSAFEKAEISLSGGFDIYAKRICDYLQTEYNTPFKEFVDKASVKDIEDAYNNHLPAENFVDEVFAEDNLAQQSYVASLMTAIRVKT
jgi:hypothetical protein